MDRDNDFEIELPYERRWENLTLANDFLFCKIMQDEELCTEMIRRILPNIDVGHINFIENQKNIQEGIRNRGIRLDVFSKADNGKIYNIEIQTTNKGDLPKRARAYHMLISYDILSKDNMKTHSYKDLHDAYVIIICTFDPFKHGKHIYTFYNTCEEVHGLKLNDGAFIIFLNAMGTADDISTELKAFLDIIIGKTSEDPFIMELEKRLELAKQDSEWRREYMKFSLWEQDIRDEGEAKGEARGIAIGEARGEARGIDKAVAFMKASGLSKEYIDNFIKLTTEDAKLQGV